MKKLKTVVAAALAAMMVLTLAGCDEETPTSGGGGGGEGSVPVAVAGGESNAAVTSEDVGEKKDMEDSAVTAAAIATKDKLSYPDLKVEKRIKWMAWWDMDETAPAAELFKEVYGIPATGDNPDADGRIFEYNKVSWDARFDALSTAIASDTSPDIFPFDSTDFPYGVLMNRYQPIDDIVDVNSSKWSGAKDLMEQYVINGKHYCAFYEVSLQNLMWYRKSNIEAIGADDPQELFKQGKWDWDSFLALARKWKASGTAEEPKYVTDGYNTPEAFIATTGVPQIGCVDGKLVNNFYTPEFERAMTKLIEVMEKEDLRYPYHELNSWNQNPQAWADGQNLFLCEGVWRYEEHLKNFKKKYKWADDEIKVVPFPKDPSADKYYAEVKQDSMMWVKGSTNKAGVQAWLDCCVVTSGDEAVAEAAKEKAINNPAQAWTAELLDFLNPLYKLDGSSPLTFVVELKNGLGPAVSNSNATESPAYGISLLPYLTGESFVQLRDEHKAIINSAIDDINSRLD